MTLRSLSLSLLCFASLSLSACSSTHYSRSDRMVIGGAIGLGAGAATGTVPGALIGAGLGALIGATTY